MESWYNEQKLIVPLSQLLVLLEAYYKCAGNNSVKSVEKSGCYVKFQTTCTEGLCSYRRHWANAKENVTKQAVNVMLSGGILFTTCLVSKVLRALTSVNIAVHAKRTYSRHQRRYLFPVSA